MASTSLPSEHRILVSEEAGQQLQLRTQPLPTAIAGTVVVRVLAAIADSNVPDRLASNSYFSTPRPFTPGGRFVGRVAATGPDTTTLEVGQLVVAEPFIRGRDDPSVQILWGGFDGPSAASKRLMANNWKAAGYSEYCRTPLENVYALNEKLLLGSPADGGFGYSVEDLVFITIADVGYAGLRAVDVKAGERVVIAPATGQFTGAAALVALAMGAQVVAMGRNLETLKWLQAQAAPGRLQIVEITGDVEKDTAALKQWGPVDAFLDMSPAAAANSTHVRSGLLALRQEGRAVLQGVVTYDVPIPYSFITWNNLTIKGRYMYDRPVHFDFIKLVESGALKLGREGGIEVVGKFSLENAYMGFEVAKMHKMVGRYAVIMP